MIYWLFLSRYVTPRQRRNTKQFYERLITLDSNEPHNDTIRSHRELTQQAQPIKSSVRRPLICLRKWLQSHSRMWNANPVTKKVVINSWNAKLKRYETLTRCLLGILFDLFANLLQFVSHFTGCTTTKEIFTKDRQTLFDLLWVIKINK